MNKKFTPTPHNAVFKQFLGDKDVAKDFFAIWLPDEIKKLCHLDSIKLESGSFVDSKMKNYQSNILYSMKTQQGMGFIYVLVEHQSKPDKRIAWRLMRYSMADKYSTSKKNVAACFPMRFYCGKQSPYPHSTKRLNIFIRSRFSWPR